MFGSLLGSGPSWPRTNNIPISELQVPKPRRLHANCQVFELPHCAQDIFGRVLVVPGQAVPVNVVMAQSVLSQGTWTVQALNLFICVRVQISMAPWFLNMPKAWCQGPQPLLHCWWPLWRFKPPFLYQKAMGEAGLRLCSLHTQKFSRPTWSPEQAGVTTLLSPHWADPWARVPSSLNHSLWSKVDPLWFTELPPLKDVCILGLWWYQWGGGSSTAPSIKNGCELIGNTGRFKMEKPQV